MVKRARNSRVVLLLIAIGALLLATDASPPFLFTPEDASPPELAVWYGGLQHFGRGGLAQRWVNVLGSAADPESRIQHLSYRLNGSYPVALRLGPDKRRLENPGDFNIELNPADLNPGENHLVIEAANGRGLISRREVTLVFEPRQVPLPYQIDWAAVADAQDVLQIVDGQWQWDQTGIRPTAMGYDRILALGDARWTDYQVTVDVTFNGIEESAFEKKESGAHAGISLELRWVGHSNVPVLCSEPRCGWLPQGSHNKFYLEPEGRQYLGLKSREIERVFPKLPFAFEVGHTYTFKAAVKTTPTAHWYAFKAWEPAAGPEPEDWMLERSAPPGLPPFGDPPHGAVALTAHHMDVTFGTIRVEPLPPE